MRGLIPSSLLLCSACGSLLLSDGEDDEPASVPSGPATDAAVVDGGGSPDSASATTDAPSGCANATERLVTAKEDTSALQCAGSVTYGATTFLHAGYQDGNTDGKSFVYVKFDVPADVSSALTESRVSGVRLVLVEDPSEGVNKSGQLAAHVLRNDWLAGQGAAYGGADKCRKDEGNPGTGWGIKGTPSATDTRITMDIDYGVSLGAQAFTAADTQVTILLDPPTLLASWNKLASKSDELSLLIESPGSTPGSFVFASADHPSLPKPTLIFTVCP